MKKPLSKRRQPWARAAVYSLMTLSVVVIVALLMLVVLGYSYNQRDGKLEQGGLLQFSSIPTGATVTLDELTLGQRTNTKSTVDTGSHSISFDLDGYRSWKKTITITPGQIGWVNYARLVPTKVTNETIRTFSTVTSSLASPRHHYMLIHEAADQPSFELANIQDDTVRYTTLTLPATAYTAPDEGKTQSFTIDNWSNNENAVLVKHTYNDNQTEWIYLDREQPQRSININTTFGIAPARLLFGGDSNRLLFVQTDDTVRRINLDDQTLSRPLATKVANFAMYDEKTIIYTTLASENRRSVGYATTDIAQPVIMSSYPADEKPLYASMESYFNKRYVSVLYDQRLAITSGNLPTLTDKGSLRLYAVMNVPAGATELTMSRNGRFSFVRTPDGFATYDLELQKYDKTTWAYQSQNQRPLQWLDDYILLSDNAGYARMYDFDGANQQTLMQVIEGNAVTLSSNDKYVYGITQGQKGPSLTRIKMLLN